MKRVIILFTASLFFLTGCSKEETEKLLEPLTNEFFIEARINNETDFKVTGVYCSFSEVAGGVINVQGMKGDGSEGITLTFTPYKGTGEYPIVKSGTNPFVMCQYKSKSDYYSTIHSKTGMAKITSYNKEEGIIEGTFSFNGVDIKTQKKSLLVMGKFKCKRFGL